MAGDDVAPPAQGSIRVATFNVSLTEDAPGALLARLEGGRDPHALKAAEVIQRVRPDVLVLQELDRDPDGRSLTAFLEGYLGVGNGGGGNGGVKALTYAHRLFPESNTGVRSPVDLNGDGVIEGPDDRLGYGFHPGQFAFALLSRLPFTLVRTFRALLWRDVPGTRLPASRYGPAAQAVLPLSSKTHAIVGLAAPFGEVMLMAAHPTPPTFDEPPVRWNARRNADEIGLLADLLRQETSAYAVDDAGVSGGLNAGAMAVVAGDLNADPHRGEALPGAINALLKHPDVAPVTPVSAHGTATATFGGGLRVDYVLPTRSLRVTGAGVFWPRATSPLAPLLDASDHRLVWVDVTAVA